MIKMAVLYRPPEDAAAFERRYLEEHLPMVRSYANIQKAAAYKVTRSLAGECPYAYIFSGTWADREAWKADMASEAARRAAEHARSFAPPFDVVVLEELA